MEILAAVLLGATVALVAWAWPEIPERIPRHYNFRGEVDAWGGKSLLLTLVAVSAGIFVLASLTPRYPKLVNMPLAITEENRERLLKLSLEMVLLLKVNLMATFFWIIQSIVRQVPMGAWFLPVSMTLTFGIVVVYYWKMRRAA